MVAAVGEESLVSSYSVFERHMISVSQCSVTQLLEDTVTSNSSVLMPGYRVGRHLEPPSETEAMSCPAHDQFPGLACTRVHPYKASSFSGQCSKHSLDPTGLGTKRNSGHGGRGLGTRDLHGKARSLDSTVMVSDHVNNSQQSCITNTQARWLQEHLTCALIPAVW